MKIQQKKVEDARQGNGISLLLKFTELKNGQLDMSNIKFLRKEFKEISLKKENNIILDFNNVEFIDSSVIGFIVDTYNNIRNKNGTMKLINIDKNIFEIFEMLNLSRFLDIKIK